MRKVIVLIVLVACGGPALNTTTALEPEVTTTPTTTRPPTTTASTSSDATVEGSGSGSIDQSGVDVFCDAYVSFWNEYDAGQLQTLSLEYISGFQSAWGRIPFPDELQEVAQIVSRSMEIMIDAFQGFDSSSESVDERLAELYDNPATSQEMYDGEAAYESIRSYASQICDVELGS